MDTPGSGSGGRCRLHCLAAVVRLGKGEVLPPDLQAAHGRRGIGLVSLCVEDADLQKAALDTAVELANGAPSAIRWTKYALNNWLRVNGPLFDTSAALELLGFTGPEAREGLTAHVEKRKPAFSSDCPI